MTTHCAIHALDLPCPACAEVAAAEAKGYKAGLLKAAEMADAYAREVEMGADEPIGAVYLELFASRLRAIAEKG